MMRTFFLKLMMAVTICAGTSIAMAQPHAAGYVRPHSEVEANKPTTDVAVETGAYTADWNNLAAWECPDWFRDAKFGIWAHWDPQCEAEDGDWYARSMYGTGGQRTTFYNYFGHYPDHDWGYKDFCRYWTIANWNPGELIDLYYAAGARYFMAMGQHHDNYDCWDSPYQEWNSMNIGPKRDVVGDWATECRRVGMKLGVSMHGAHAWTFFEVGRDADTGVTKDEGTGKWWNGYDPQELYAQNHDHSANWSDWGTIHNQWDWGNGVCPPTVAYMQKLQNRVLQCVNKYNPDMLYFDDTVLPFYGASTNTNDQYSLNILKHFYNHSANQHSGQQQVVVCGKKLNDTHKAAMLWDVERGIPDQCQDLPWQTCTCIGGWHYSKYEGDNNMYKQADQVIRMLVDIVSKNGNLLLSIPVRGDGTIDNNERNIVNGIKAWMDINSVSIYGTRPWKVYGEGPLFETANPINGQGFNEGINYTSSDVRYVQKNGKVYATIMRWPNAGDFHFNAFGITSEAYSGSVSGVTLLGYGNVPFTYDGSGLTVTVPSTHPNDIAPVFEITLAETTPYQTLQTLIDYMGTIPASMIGVNTGKYTSEAYATYQAAVTQAQSVSSSADENTVNAAIIALRAAADELNQNGKVAGGDLGLTGDNLTVEKLIEASGFSATNMGSRFGTPVNWTVADFYIPQNNSNGTKNGIDNEPGYNTLMAGVWSGEDGTPTGDLTKARIYRQVTLPAGEYYFAATYFSAYQLNDQAYIFASTSANMTTANLPEQSLAYYPLNKCTSKDSHFYGIRFTLTEETTVYLGWQVDLTRGSNTQQFQVERVKLIRVNPEAIDVEQTAASPTTRPVVDLTIGELIEAGHIDRETPFASMNMGSRYGTPVNWTVENYSIPSGQGTRNGYDNYNGWGSLSIGIWDDRQNNDGDGTNARIYRHLVLDPGTYYFGARYETRSNWGQSAYLFASTQLLNTNEIPSKALACHPLGQANAGNNWYGIEFKLTRRQDVYVGWQIDITQGGTQQEFRAKSVRLLRTDRFIDLTEEKLIEARNFSRTDAGGNPDTRFGLLGEPWVVTDNILNQDNGAHGGYDGSYGPSLGVEKWTQTAAIENGKIYQTTKVELPSGNYKLRFNRNTLEGNPADGTYVLRVIKGESFPDKGVDTGLILASYDMNQSGSNGEHDACNFTLSEAQKVTIGWLINLPADKYYTNFRVSDIRLINVNSGNDISATYLENYANPLQRKDKSWPRYGTPTYWTVENYGISSGSGTRNGIDKDPGPNCLSLGIWGDRGGIQGDNTKTRLYRQVHLDAGLYYFGATYNTQYQFNNDAYFFAATALTNTSEIPTASTTLAYKRLNTIPHYNRSDREEKYYVTFELTEAADVYLGWQVDFSQGEANQEFRVLNVDLLKLVPYTVLNENDEQAQAPTKHPFGDVEITRTLKAGQWNTFCVPFSMDIPDGWTVKKMKSATTYGENYGVVFEESNTIEAGVPYIVKPEEAVTDWVVENVTVDPTLHDAVDGDITFTGNMYKTTVPVGSFYVANSQFWQSDGSKDVTLKGFRAIFTPADPASVKSLTYDFEEPTGIEQVMADNESLTIYDLSGRRISKPSKGFYIVNGKKVFIK